MNCAICSTSEGTYNGEPLKFYISYYNSKGALTAGSTMLCILCEGCIRNEDLDYDTILDWIDEDRT